MGALLWTAAIMRHQRTRDTAGGSVKDREPSPAMRDTTGSPVYVEGVEIAPPPVPTFLTAEEVLTRAEAALENASTPYMREQAARIGGIRITDLADFRHAVRTAEVGALVSVSGCQAQFDFYPCVGQLQDGTRLFSDESHPGIDAEEWALIAD